MAVRYLGIRPQSSDFPMDDVFRDGIYQRPCGPHPSGPLCTLELWERRAVEILKRFEEVDDPDPDDIGVPVCGRWRFYTAPDAETDNWLCNMAAALWAISDAFELFEALRDEPSYATGCQVAWACMTAINMLTDVGVVTSDTWQAGEGLQARGRTLAAVANADHVELHDKYQPAVDAYMANGRSYAQATVQVAADLGVSERTVRNHTVNPRPRNRSRHGRR